jgi:hypothetical protein
MVVLLGRIVWARSATKHRIRKHRSRFVIERCGLIFRVPSTSDQADDRLVFLGDDEDGQPLEVVAVELDDGGLLVIHAMDMQERYRPLYEEAKRWQI